MDREDYFESFEQAWLDDGAPDIGDFLREMAEASAVRGNSKTKDEATEEQFNSLCELVKIDMHRRWELLACTSIEGAAKSEELPHLEYYLKRFSQLRLHGFPQELLLEELIARVETSGEVFEGSEKFSSPSIEELTRRFPQQSTNLLTHVLEKAETYCQRQNQTGEDLKDDGVTALSTRAAAAKFAGRYEFRRLLGQGGMGSVYLAFDPRLQRDVAVKIPLFSFSANSIMRERFLREGRAAGSISHPNVVTVYEINDNDSDCYIVSEYVDGPTLKEWLAENKRTDPVLAARMLQLLAQGVQAAHDCGVVHRDLKPANVLLELSKSNQGHDSSSESTASSTMELSGETARPRITDFGLAIFSEPGPELTHSGSLVGTAAYMSPEQVNSAHVGPQADVFALGVILHEMLTGESLFGRETYANTIARVLSFEPPPLHKQRRNVPRDLSAICECALNKDVLSRYLTAQEMKDDLARYLAGTPVRARSLSPMGRAVRWAKRNPIPTSLAILLTGALVWSIWQTRLLNDSLNSVEELRVTGDTVRQELTDANANYREEVYVQDMILAFQAWEKRSTEDVAILLRKYRPKTNEEFDLRGAEWFYLSNQIATKAPMEFRGHSDAVNAIVAAPDGKSFYSASHDGTMRHWNLQRGEIRKAIFGEKIRALSISSDGAQLFYGGESLYAWDSTSGQQIRRLADHAYGVRAIAVSPNRNLVVSTSFKHDLQLNYLDETELTSTSSLIPAFRANRIDFSPDGRYLYFAEEGEKRSDRFIVWDVAAEKSYVSLPPALSQFIGPVDAATDGDRVAVGCHDFVHVFSLSEKDWIAQSASLRGYVLDCEFSPDNRWIACAIEDGTVAVLDTSGVDAMRTGLPIAHSFRETKIPIRKVAWVDSNHLLSAGDDGVIRLYELSHSKGLEQFSFPERTLPTANGAWIASIANGDVTLSDAASRKPFATIRNFLSETEADPTKKIVVDPNHHSLAWLGNTEVKLWNLKTKTMVATIKHLNDVGLPRQADARIYDCRFAPDGSQLATTGRDSTVHFWDTKSGKLVRKLKIDNFGRIVSYSPTGTHVLVGGELDCFVLNLSEGTRTQISEIPAASECIHWLDDDRVLIAFSDRSMVVFDVKDGRSITDFENQSHKLYFVDVSPDQRTVVTLGSDRLQFWHLKTGRRIGSVPIRHSGKPNINRGYRGVHFVEGGDLQWLEFSKGQDSRLSRLNMHP